MAESGITSFQLVGIKYCLLILIPHNNHVLLHNHDTACRVKKLLKYIIRLPVQENVHARGRLMAYCIAICWFDIWCLKDIDWIVLENLVTYLIMPRNNPSETAMCIVPFRQSECSTRHAYDWTSVTSQLRGDDTKQRGIHLDCGQAPSSDKNTEF